MANTNDSFALVVTCRTPPSLPQASHSYSTSRSKEKVKVKTPSVPSGSNGEDKALVENEEDLMKDMKKGNDTSHKNHSKVYYSKPTTTGFTLLLTPRTKW